MNTVIHYNHYLAVISYQKFYYFDDGTFYVQSREINIMIQTYKSIMKQCNVQAV